MPVDAGGSSRIFPAAMFPKEQAAGTYELERRKGLYYAAERLITDDVPYVFLNYTAEFAVMGRKVQNWGVGP